MDDLEKFNTVDTHIDPLRPRIPGFPIRPEDEGLESKFVSEGHSIPLTVQRAIHESSYDDTSERPSEKFTLIHKDGSKTSLSVPRPKDSRYLKCRIDRRYRYNTVGQADLVYQELVVTFIKYTRKKPESPFPIPGPEWNSSAHSPLH